MSDENLARLADRDTVKQSVRDHHEFPADFNKHARFQNSRQLAFRARLGIADFLIENNDGILRIKTHIALLCVGEVHPLQCLNSRVRRAKQSFAFQRITHARVDVMHFTPSLRDDDRRSVLLREPEIFVGELVGLFANATRDNRAHFVEAFK